MSICANDVLSLRLARPSERYARIARKDGAMEFARELANVLPGCGARVYLGTDARRVSPAEGYIVTMGDDTEAAIVSGAGREIARVGIK